MTGENDDRRRDDIARGSPLDGVEVGADAAPPSRPTYPLSHEDFRNARHLPVLDGLRALSVALVFFFHANPTRTAFLSGWEGVTTFFILSGFLITTLLLREHEDTGQISLRAFYARRVFRIFPLYFFVLAVHYVLIVLAGIGQNAPQFRAALPYYLTYMSEWAPHPPSTPFSQSWTLGIEEKYYLVWPFLIGLLLHRSFRARIGVVATLVLIPILTLPLGLSPNYQEIIFTAYGRILIGCLIALCLHDARIYERLRVFGRRSTSTVVACLFVASLLLVHAWKSNVSLYAFPFVAGLLVITLIIGDGGASRLLSKRAFRYIGTRAYGIYLLDSLANRAAGYVTPTPSDWPRTLLFFSVRFVIAFVIADLLFRVIERPMISVGKRVSRRLRARSSAPASLGPASAA
jgi:peptidoglycan/LPS O-acetylase OafA/YrhL